MNTAPFSLTPSAARDIDEILNYVLEHDGSERALRLHARLYEACGRIACYPGIGHRRDDLADESLRVWATCSLLIIYRPETRPLQIIRVLHGARDLPSIFDATNQQ